MGLVVIKEDNEEEEKQMYSMWEEEREYTDSWKGDV